MRGALCVVALLLAAPATAAALYRAPTTSERRAIVAAIHHYQLLHDCATTKTCSPQISHVRISLANTAFASAALYFPKIGGALALLHKKYRTWRVVDLGSSDVGCGGTAPKAVRVDLELTCPNGK